MHVAIHALMYVMYVMYVKYVKYVMYVKHVMYVMYVMYVCLYVSISWSIWTLCRDWQLYLIYTLNISKLIQLWLPQLYLAGRRHLNDGRPPDEHQAGACLPSGGRYCANSRPQMGSAAATLLPGGRWVNVRRPLINRQAASWIWGSEMAHIEFRSNLRVFYRRRLLM